MTQDNRANAQVHIQPNQFWLLILCTVRYAMGRTSYVVSEAAQLVKDYRRYLTDGQISQLRGEIEKELAQREALGKSLGHLMDHETWRDLTEELKVRP